MLMHKTRKTHWFGKYAEFSSVSEEIPGKIEESRIILDVGIVACEVGQCRNILFLLQPIFGHDNRILNTELL
jgi:hypothetical protein